MRITRADFSNPQLTSLLSLHLNAAAAQEASHAYDIQQLQSPDIHMFTAVSDAGELMGCAAIKILSAKDGEIKSVRTHPDYLRKGVSHALMDYVEDFARKVGLLRVNLETHPTTDYAAARALYEKRGYGYSGPFGDYMDEPSSVFMTKAL